MSGPYQPQQGPWQQPRGYGLPGYPPPQPPKSDTGVIVALSILVVVLLATLGITGFVAPGFFLGDKDEKQAGDRPPATSAAPPAPAEAPPATAPAEDEGQGGKDRIDEFWAALTDGDATGAKDQLCEQAKRSYRPQVDDLVASGIESASPPSVDTATERRVKAFFFAHTTGPEVEMVDGWVTARFRDDEWCIESIDITGP